MLFLVQNRLLRAPDDVNETPLNYMCFVWRGMIKKWKNDIIGKLKKSKAYRGNRNIAQLILNFDIVWRWIVNSTFRPFYPPGKNPGIQRTGGCVGPRGSQQVSGQERDFYCPYWVSMCINQYRRKLWHQLLAERNSLDHRRIFVHSTNPDTI